MPIIGNTFQTEIYSINYQYFKTYHYEDEQKSTEEQRTEIRERGSSKSNRFGNHSKADNITFTAERAHGYRSDGNTRNGKKHRSKPRSKHRLQRPQPKPTLILPPYSRAQTTTVRRSMTHLCRNLRKVFGRLAFCRLSQYAHTRQEVTKSFTENAVIVPHCLQEQRR